MTPPAEVKDAGYDESRTSPSLNKPPPAFSSPTSPGISEREGSQSLPSPQSPTSIYDPTSYFGARPPACKLNHGQERSRSPASLSYISTSDVRNESRTLIVRSLAPRVALYASPDTDEIVTAKGIRGGLSALLRPYGERVPGNVVIRDSHGISKAWNDFGIRISDASHIAGEQSALENSNNLNGSALFRKSNPAIVDAGTDTVLHHLLDQTLHTSRTTQNGASRNDSLHTFQPSSSTIFLDFLRTLLSSNPTVPYEIFDHPVACLVAVSSRNQAPIETLRQLYAATGRNNPKMPVWIGTEYLRYYILVHDEDHDDIAKSTALFDLMKRHFGLHCHLLRLRSSHCVATDDDSIQIPQIEWVSSYENQASLKREGKWSFILTV